MLGANCLVTAFLDGRTLLDAHRTTLEALAVARFSVTEISQPGLLPHRDATIVRDHAEQLGVEIRAVHAPPMRRDPTLARQRAAARLAAELGASVLVVHVSSLRFASPHPAVRTEARERDLRCLDTLAAICQPLGLTLGLENGKHPAHSAYLLTLLEALTPSPPAGLVFDAGHAALGGDPVTVAQAMQPRLVHTHLHDNHGARDEHLAPGDGRIDWPTLLDCLSSGSYTGPLLLELRPRRGASAADWQQELARGRKVLSAALP
jgi:sugar phosphate isomerase/epimerase